MHDDIEIHQQWHDEYYTKHFLDMDEEHNHFDKIADLWIDLPKGSKVLDIGCGAGSVVEKLVKDGYDVYGVDIQKEAIKRARSKGIKAQVHDLNKKLPFEDNFFDAIICYDVIDFLYSPVTVLQDIERILNDHGYVIFSVPLHFDIVQRLKMLFGGGIVSYKMQVYNHQTDAWEYQHIRFFTLKDVKNIIKRAGFQIDVAKYTPIFSGVFNIAFNILLKSISNRYTIRFCPTLLASGVKFRLKKAKK